MSSALTVLKQEIPSPFGNDQPKKVVKTSLLNKDQVDDISQIEQATGASIKAGASTISNTTGTTVVAAVNSTNVAGVTNPNSITCHLNGNSNSSASNDFGNCLENVTRNQQQSNPNDELNDSSNLSMFKLF